MAWEPSKCARILTIVVIVILIWIVIAAPKESFKFFKTPYPAQCPPQGMLTSAEAPSSAAPYIGSDDTIQLVPSRCSGNDDTPFMTRVYNRNTSPMTEERRGAIQELTGVRMLGPKDHMRESFGYSVGNYGDIILDSAMGLYPKSVDSDSYRGMYV